MGWHIGDSTLDTLNFGVEKWIQENQGQIEKLGRYYEANYQKKTSRLTGTGFEPLDAGVHHR